MATVAFDDSFGTLQERLCVVAGWVGEDDVLAAFTEEWQHHLIKFGLNEFKAANCQQGQGAFKTWDFSHRDACRRTFAEVIATYELTGLWAAINIADCQNTINQARQWLASRQPGN